MSAPRDEQTDEPIKPAWAPAPLSQFDEIARLIARDLFTNGNGRRAMRLVLEPEGRRIDGGLGGWSEQAVARRIETLLRENSGSLEGCDG